MFYFLVQKQQSFIIIYIMHERIHKQVLFITKGISSWHTSLFINMRYFNVCAGTNH